MNADDVQVIGLTLGSAALSTVLILPFGVALAWVMARKKWPGKIAGRDHLSRYRWSCRRSQRASSLLNFLGRRRGPLGNLARDMCSGPQIVFTWKAVVAAMAVMSFPFLVRTARLAFEEIDPAPGAGRTYLGRHAPARVFTDHYAAAGHAGDHCRLGLGLCPGDGRVRCHHSRGGKYSGAHHRRYQWRFYSDIDARPGRPCL